MKRYFAVLIVLEFLFALPLAASDVRIWVLNSAGASISVIDPETNKVVQTIEGMNVPNGVAFSPDGRLAYVSEDSVFVLDARKGEIINKVALSGHPNLLAISKDGKRLLVCIAEDPPLSGVEIIDTSTLKTDKILHTGGWMHDIFISPDGKFAVADSPGKKFMIVIDIQKEEIVWSLDFDPSPQTMAIEAGPDGSTSRIFLQLKGLQQFAVVDFAKRKEVARIVLPDQPRGLGRYPYGTSHGAGITPDGKTYFVNSTALNVVFAYSLPDLKYLGYATLPTVKLPGKEVPLGSSPDWLTFSPDSKTVYVSDAAVKLVSAIDVKTLKTIALIPVGEIPKRIETVELH
jgi:YVTN family beta-propeller protein